MLAFAIAATLNAPLDSILNSPDLNGAIASVTVLDGSGRTLYDRHGEMRIIPASNQKVLTCAFAMDALGPAHQVRTRIWKDSLSPNTFIVDAPGDPTLTQEQLRQAAKELKAPANSRFFVRQAFDVGYPPSWEWDDLAFYYAAPIHAFTFDKSSFEAFAENGQLVPFPGEFGITVKRKQRSSRKVTYTIWTKEFLIEGPLPQSRTRLGGFAIPDPHMAAARILGGEFQAWTSTLPNRPADVTFTSAPVRDLIKDCLEPSDNIMAEHLLLMAGAASSDLGENPYAAAAARMNGFLENKAGMPKGSFRPRDGSGLSRQNLVTTKGIASLLAWCDQQPWAADYRRALAAPGEGTLRSRLKASNFVGKTGTINAVSSLSGIVNPDSPAKRRYVSVVMNSSLVSSSKLRKLQDDIVREVARQAEGTAARESQDQYAAAAL